MKAKKLAIKIILVVLTLTILLPVGLFANSKNVKAAGGPEQCIADTGNHAHAENSMVVTFCDETYVYDVARSQQSNPQTPTFVSGDKNDEGGTFILTLVNCSGVLGVNIIRPNKTGVQSPEGKQCVALDDKDKFGNNPQQIDGNNYPADMCTMIKTTDCTIWDGKSELFNNNGPLNAGTLVKDGDNQGNYNILDKGQPFKGPAPGKDYADDVSKLPKANSESNTCSAKGGALAFIFCPMLEAISSGIQSLIGAQGSATDTSGGLLTDLLKVPPLDANTESGAVVSAVLNNLIAFANIFYILLFVVIIFANVIPIGIDNYTIKKTLPRLIIAIILTQFSFLICSIAVDIGNLLGFGVPNLLYKAVTGVPNFANQNSQIGGIPTALAALPIIGLTGLLPILSTVGIILVVVILVAVFIGVLIAFFWLLARYLIVYFLIFLTPIAFAAMVLPGTQKYFKMWAEDFVKVLLTFPLVTGMLAGSLVIANILTKVLNAQSKPGNTDLGIPEIMVGLIPIIALMAVPKTLKWGGKISSAVGGAIGGYIGAKAGSAKNVAKGAGKSGAKAGYSMAKPEAAVRMGRSNNRYVRSAGRALAGKENLIPGQRGEANWQRFRGGLIEQHRKDAALRFATMDSDGTGHELGNILEQLAVRPNDERLQGQAQAAIARLGTLGSRGYAQLAQAQNRYNIAVQNNGGAALNAASIGGVTGDPGVTPANRATAAWRDMIGASGIYSDVDTKAPELLDVSTTAAGAPNQYNTVTIGGNDYQVRDEVVDLHNKGAGDLGQVKAGTVATMANQTNPVFERQAAQLNWQAASTMARTPQLHPKDAAAIDIWRQVAQRGVAHWEAAGNAAAAAGDDAAFEEATRNQQYAQDIIDHL